MSASSELGRAQTIVHLATVRDLIPVCVSYSYAQFAPRSRLLNMLALPFAVVCMLFFIPAIAAREVYVAGRGTSVTMTRRPRDRPATGATLAGIAVAALLAVIVFVVVPLGLGALLAITTRSPALSMLAELLYFGILVASVLVVARMPHATPAEREALRELRELYGHVVLLHDLVRDPRDAPGSGTALLAAMLAEPRFQSSPIVLTAAHPVLADRYIAAGCTPYRPDSLTLVRNP
ncbi:MAG: hypothetical protein QM598_05815 [Protaetiibacter sp.]